MHTKWSENRRRVHAVLAADEQRVVQRPAQPAQRAADCGLRQAQALRRARHAPLTVDGVDDPQQVQVELHVLRHVIHGVDGPY